MRTAIFATLLHFLWDFCCLWAKDPPTSSPSSEDFSSTEISWPSTIWSWSWARSLYMLVPLRNWFHTENQEFIKKKKNHTSTFLWLLFKTVVSCQKIRTYDVRKLHVCLTDASCHYGPGKEKDWINLLFYTRHNSMSRYRVCFENQPLLWWLYINIKPGLRSKV